MLNADDFESVMRGSERVAERRLLWLGPDVFGPSAPSWSALERAGFAVRGCADAREAGRAFVRTLPDLIVVDARSEEVSARALLRRMQEVAGVPIVCVSAGGTQGEAAGGTRREGGAGWVVELAEADLARLPQLACELIEVPYAPSPLRSSESAPGGEWRAARLTAAQVRSRARAELRDALARELVACRGNLAEVGRRLGKDRSTIRYHLRRFGMLGEEALELHEGSGSPLPSDAGSTFGGASRT